METTNPSTNAGNPERLPRKLVAILYADVADYSRLTHRDEDTTHRRLSEYLDLISSIVGRHCGDVMHHAGDAVLARFEAITDALGCAGDIQRDLADRNAELASERKVHFRIGVNIGDVIEARHDIYGDGVNVAVRLEQMARPGGICISGTVHDAISGKLPFDFEYIGEQRVKNIDTPVRAYHAQLKAGASLPTARGVSRYRSGTPYVTVAIALALMASVGLLAWFQPWRAGETVPDVAEDARLPLPDKPSIAVLPFANMSDDPDQEYFVDGLAEDVITDLAKISGLFVVSRNSSFTYKREPVDVRRVGRELGVRYALEGSVRRAGDRLRISTQLIDATTGEHLWAERYDGTLTDIFALQDRLTLEIVTALAIKLTTEEEQGRQHRDTNDPEAYDEFLQGWAHYRRYTRDDYAVALTHFKRAVGLDPGFASAHAALAGIYLYTRIRDWGDHLGVDDAYAMAKHHLQLAMRVPTPLAHRIASRMFAWEGRYDKAIVEAERAVKLNPNDADGYGMMGMVLVYAGQPSRAIDVLKRSMRLDPYYPPGRQWSLGLAYFGLAQFELAVNSFERARQRNPELAAWPQAAAYAHLDRVERARETLIEYRSLRGRNTDLSQIKVDRILDYYRFVDAGDMERLGSGLVKAGLCCPDRLERYLQEIAQR